MKIEAKQEEDLFRSIFGTKNEEKKAGFLDELDEGIQEEDDGMGGLLDDEVEDEEIEEKNKEEEKKIEEDINSLEQNINE